MLLILDHDGMIELKSLYGMGLASSSSSIGSELLAKKNLTRSSRTLTSRWQLCCLDPEVPSSSQRSTYHPVACSKHRRLFSFSSKRRAFSSVLLFPFKIVNYI